MLPGFSHHRSPVALTFRPSSPAWASSLWQRGHTGSTSRRQEAVSFGSPLQAVSAKLTAGVWPQKVQASQGGSIAPTVPDLNPQGVTVANYV